MRKRKVFAFTAALTVLFIAGCQIKETADIPASASIVESASQNEMLEVPEAPSASTGGNREPESLSKQSLEMTLRNAQVLTEHMINRVFHEGIVEHGESITDRELFYFFTTLPGYMQNQDHPYGDAVTLTPDSLYIFPEEAVRQSAYELFGFEDWAFDDSMMAYNADAGQYESGLEFGTGANRYRCSDPQAAYLAEFGVVEVVFELEGAASIDGAPSWEHLGRYVARFQVVQENGMFLRYENIQKTK